MFDKLITSSADTKQLSLTVKGILVAMIPVGMVFLGMTEAEVNGLIDVIVNIVFYSTSLLSALQVAYGLVRKIYLKRWSAE